MNYSDVIHVIRKRESNLYVLHELCPILIIDSTQCVIV